MEKDWPIVSNKPDKEPLVKQADQSTKDGLYTVKKPLPCK